MLAICRSELIRPRAGAVGGAIIHQHELAVGVSFVQAGSNGRTELVGLVAGRNDMRDSRPGDPSLRGVSDARHGTVLTIRMAATRLYSQYTSPAPTYNLQNMLVSLLYTSAMSVTARRAPHPRTRCASPGWAGDTGNLRLTPARQSLSA